MKQKLQLVYTKRDYRDRIDAIIGAGQTAFANLKRDHRRRTDAIIGAGVLALIFLAALPLATKRDRPTEVGAWKAGGENGMIANVCLNKFEIAAGTPELSHCLDYVTAHSNGDYWGTFGVSREQWSRQYTEDYGRALKLSRELTRQNTASGPGN